MTLVEANELFESWSHSPPVNLLLQGLLLAFGGQKTNRPQGLPSPVEPQRLSASGAITNPSDSDLAQISVKSGGAMMVRHGPDVGLVNMQPVFTVEAMQRKNRERIALRAAQIRNIHRG